MAVNSNDFNLVQRYLDLMHDASAQILGHIVKSNELDANEKAVLLLEVSSAHMRLFEFINSRLDRGEKNTTPVLAQQIERDATFQ